jgi:hypothetical protein
MDVTSLRAEIASVTYTNAASASPVETAFNVAVASIPREIFDSESETPWRDSTAAAYKPQGIVFAHKETVDALFRSFTVLIPSGFPDFTTSCSEFRANTIGDFTMLPLASNLSKLAKSAAANISVGAPD